MSLMRERNGPRYKHAGDEAAPYDTIALDKLTPIIGAEIGGVDLARPLGNQQIDEIHRALAENFGDLLPRPAPVARSSTSPSAASSAICTSTRRRPPSPVTPS